MAAVSGERTGGGLLRFPETRIMRLEVSSLLLLLCALRIDIREVLSCSAWWLQGEESLRDDSVNRSKVCLSEVLDETRRRFSM